LLIESAIGVIKPFGVLRRRHRESKTLALTAGFSILECGPSGPQSRPTLRCRRLRRDPDLSLLPHGSDHHRARTEWTRSDAAPCGQVRPFIDFLVERFASQPEGDLKLSAQARSVIRDSRPGHAWSRLGTIPRSRVLHPCYRAARRLSAFDGQRAIFEGTAVFGAKRTFVAGK
jgi:hypothetical protein